LKKNEIAESMNFIALDIETTGLEKEHSEVIEIGAVKYEKGVETSRFSTFLKTTNPIPDFIKQLTHITEEQVEHGMYPRDAFSELQSFVKSDILLCHNAEFDLPFLAYHFEKYDLFPMSNLYWDTLEIARIYQPFLANHKLDTLASFFELKNEGAHRAIYDAEITGKILIKEFQFIDEFIPVPVNYQLSQIAHLASLESGLSFFLEKVVEFQRTNALLKKKPAEWKITNQHLISHVVPDAKSLEVNDIFKQDGYFGKQFPHYEFRPGQLEMAEAVKDSFEKEEYLLVEAGTGIGKSFAYLIPAIQIAIEKKEKVVISTNTKNLQEQLMGKDLPAISKILPLPFKALLLKGRDNYLCEKRWQEILFDFGKNLNRQELEGLLYVVVWREFSQTGDISENGAFDRSRYNTLWKKLLADRYFCSGKKCSLYGHCHLMELRQEQESANLLIVNHSLLLTDILNENTTLGKYRYLVVDEAHNLPQIASKHLGINLSYGDFSSFFSLLAHSGKSQQSGLIPAIQQAAEKSMLPPNKIKIIVNLSELITNRLSEGRDLMLELFQYATSITKEKGSYGKHRIKNMEDFPHLSDLFSKALEYWNELDKDVTSLHMQMSEFNSNQFPDYDNHFTNLEGIRNRLTEFENELNKLNAPDMINYAYWLESSGFTESAYPTASFNYAPLEVNDLLARCLYSAVDSAIFTSATIAIRGIFKYFVQQMGLNLIESKIVRERVVPSPFEFEKQSALLTTGFLPDPNDMYFSNQSIDVLRRVLEASNVGSMVLFTSYRDLNLVYDALEKEMFEKDILLLAQGKGASRSAILNEFREHGSGVLLGTNSFWEGIDVQGESLSLLIIYKLPFQVPTEPIVEAYIEKIEREGKNSFMNYILPNALLKLRQGFGRLIRSKTDRGIVLILDNRVVTKQYGVYFKEVLPTKCHEITNILELENAVIKFFRKG
jgi:ATP-dependent DNA helicase DinG